MSYQSFSEGTGDSPSHEKLKMLQMPEDFAGRSFLDVGCNEGFFCGEALKRGASRAVGIDANASLLIRARERFPEADFVHSSWEKFPDEKFDVVLFASAIHYEPDPQRLC